MRLNTVQVMNFKCIEDSGQFNIDPVTCLVGKNEAGKTALLEALHKLNPDVTDNEDFDLLPEYPRRRKTDYDQEIQNGGEPHDGVITTWHLDEEDVAAIEEMAGENTLQSSEIQVRKGYYPELRMDMEIDEASMVTFLVNSSNLGEAQRSQCGCTDSIDGLVSLLEEKEDQSQEEADLLETVRTVKDNIRTELKKRMPTFVYFDQYYDLPGRVSVNQVIDREGRTQLQDQDRVFLALLRLAQTTPQELLDVGLSEELISQLEAIQAHITDKIFEYWSQNKDLQVRFDFRQAKPEDPPPANTGQVFETRIWNDRHRVSLNLDKRSRGFIWFVSFLVWFWQARQIYGENLILLLDDPGLGLHARAQQDLLRYISNELEPHYQVIYTTHSPFMVDPEHLLRARTVEDVVTTHDGEQELHGTMVGDKVLSTDKDTLFPLQAALGYEITQTLFVGANSLVVEGASDLLYLKWFSQRLTELERVALDPAWTITPVGGVGNVSAFVTLFGASDINVAVFIDFKNGQKGKVRQLRQHPLLKEAQIFTADMYTAMDEADVEDVIGREMYFEIVNKCYELEESHKLDSSSPAGDSGLVVEEVEEHFRVNLPAEGPPFSHLSPAEYLLERGAAIMDDLPDLDGALDRFEKLFEDLNGCLPSV